MDEFDIFDQEEEFEDSIYRDLAYLDRELSDEEKILIENDRIANANADLSGDKKADKKLSNKEAEEAEERLFNSLIDTLPGNFGWKKDLPPAEALDVMIKNGDILDKDGDKLVGDFPSERRDNLKKRLLNGDTLFIYKEGEKYPRQLTYDANSKEFEVSEPVEKLELEKVPKPHWLVRFYFNLFSLMYRGRSLDAVRDWEHYEEQKRALAKAKSKSRIDRRRRRDSVLDEKEKEKEKEKGKEKEKTEEKVKEEAKEEQKEIIRNVGPQYTSEIRRAGPQYTSEIRNAGPQGNEEAEKEIDGVISEKEILNMDKQFEEMIQKYPEHADHYRQMQNDLKQIMAEYKQATEEYAQLQNEQGKTEEREQPAADARGPVINQQQPKAQKTDLDAVEQDTVSQQRTIEQQRARLKQNKPITENKPPEEAEKERQRQKELQEKENEINARAGSGQGARGADRKNQPDGRLTETDDFIRTVQQREKAKMSAVMEKNLRTLYENAQNAKKQLSIACEKGEQFKGGDSIAHLVAYNNIKNQIESGGLSNTAQKILSSPEGAGTLYNGVMCDNFMKYAKNSGHVPSFFQDYFLTKDGKDGLDARTKAADKAMQSFLENACGDRLDSSLDNLSNSQTIYQPVSRNNLRQVRQQQRQQAGLGGP